MLSKPIVPRTRRANEIVRHALQAGDVAHGLKAYPVIALLILALSRGAIAR
jgi:hypothetical protein